MSFRCNLDKQFNRLKLYFLLLQSGRWVDVGGGGGGGGVERATLKLSQLPT